MADADPACVENEAAGSAKAGDLEAFASWLQGKGVDFAGCTIRASKEEGFGCGVFAPPSARDETVYDPEDSTEGVFLVSPLMSAITSLSAAHDPRLGHLYTQLLRDDVLDERKVVMLFLLVERAIGEDSDWAPYFKVLPRSFSTSMHFSPEELEELRGTSLYNATRAKLSALHEEFEERFHVIVQHAFSAAGLADKSVGFDDFLCRGTPMGFPMAGLCAI